MKTYLVGGAVRDQILGLPVNDRDFVVVGSTVQEMLDAGFQMVGKDFPVFLHPVTKEEYALARTERKIAVGHTGFICNTENVSIEGDLYRRDLTINAIALEVGVDFETGEIIYFDTEYTDPYGGLQDIKDKVIRNVSDHFFEDPLRVLRAFRFLAKLGKAWVIEEYFLYELNNYVSTNHYKELTPERVWLEFEKALKTPNPMLFFNELTDTYQQFYDMCFTDQRRDHHPEGSVWTHTNLVVEYAAEHYSDPEINFACLTHDFGKPECWDKYGNAHGHENVGLKHIESFCEEVRVPNRYKELALLVCEHHTKIHGILGRGTQKMSKAQSVMKLFIETNAIKKTERFKQILRCCVADSRGRGADEIQIEEFHNKPYPQEGYLLECLAAVKNLDTKAISSKALAEGKGGKIIGDMIHRARLAEIKKIQDKYK